MIKLALPMLLSIGRRAFQHYSTPPRFLASYTQRSRCQHPARISKSPLASSFAAAALRYHLAFDGFWTVSLLTRTRVAAAEKAGNAGLLDHLGHHGPLERVPSRGTTA